MKWLLAPLIALALPFAAIAQERGDGTAADTAPEGSVLELWQADPAAFFPAADVTLSDFLYIARPVVVFADSPNDPRYVEQIALLSRDQQDLVARDVILIVDTDPTGGSDARRTLRPRGFALVIIGKDGRIAQRKPAPWDVREIGRAIDKLPLRQQEIRDGL